MNKCTLLDNLMDSRNAQGANKGCERRIGLGTYKERGGQEMEVEES